ncbi:MAG: hypothetical protein IPP51_18540 [Bacteroidetes bacterium]|nr:hypothetical protein [Bacteroidota bacterium]
MLIDGIEVWNHEDCCDYHENVWEGILTDTSTIEFRVMEFGGGSYGVVDVIPQTLTASATSTLIHCYNGTSDVTVSASGGFPPYTGTGTFTVTAGTYDYLITDSLGAEFTLSVNVPSPLTPDTLISTNTATTFCDGDSVLLTAPSHGQAVSFAGAPNRILIPFDSPETNYTYELDFKTTEPNTGISSVRDGDLAGSHDRNLYLENGQIMHRLYSEEVIGSSNENYADGEWHHVAVVVESGVGQRIYVDGVEVASGYMDHSDFNWDNTINLGFGNDWYIGSIDNVRLWNVVRTQTEIEEDQTLHANSAIAGLIGNWDFDESDGYTAYNSIDNSTATFEEGPSLFINNSSTYSWNTGETTQSIVARTGGIYTVAVSVSNACTMNSPTIELVMNPSPAIPSMSTTSVLSFCEGSEAIFICSDSGSVQWNQNGIPVDGDTISNFKAEEEGDYSVTITNSYGCSQTSSEQFVEVFPAPRAPYIEASGPIAFCAGESVDLTAKTNT